MVSDAPVLRMGVIGCGRIAQVAHLPAIAKEPSVQLVAVSDPSSVLATAVGARYGVPGHTDTADLLREDLDAVLIAVPDRFHESVGTQGLEADKHVLIEKPAAIDSAQAPRRSTGGPPHRRDPVSHLLVPAAFRVARQYGGGALPAGRRR
jgi:predicted dehydrogenase